MKTKPFLIETLSKLTKNESLHGYKEDLSLNFWEILEAPIKSVQGRKPGSSVIILIFFLHILANTMT